MCICIFGAQLRFLCQSWLGTVTWIVAVIALLLFSVFWSLKGSLGAAHGCPTGFSIWRCAMQRCFFKSFILRQMRGKFCTSKPPCSHVPVGLKAAAASPLWVRRTKGPEKQPKGQLRAIELGPSSASQPGRLLSPHWVQRDTWSAVSCASKKIGEEFPSPPLSTLSARSYNLTHLCLWL